MPRLATSPVHLDRLGWSVRTINRMNRAIF
jgi:hypothetical protein